MSDTSTRILKNTSFLYGKMITTFVVALYSARVCLNVLGASDYGLYTLIAGVIFMFGFLQDTLTRSTLRYLCYYKTQNNILYQTKVYSISIFLHLAIALVIIINLLLVTNFLFSGFLKIDPDRIYAAKMVYFCMIASFSFTVMSVPYDSVLNANEDMLYYSLVGIIENILKLGLAFYLPFVEYDPLIFFSVVSAFITILSLLVKRIYCHMKYEECKIGIRYYDKKLAAKMVSYAGWNFLTSISSLISFNMMPILLNRFFGTIANAAQGVAGMVNGNLTAFSTNMLKALNPTIAKTGSGNDIARMLRFGFTGSKLAFLITGILSLPILIECPYVLRIWLINVPAWTTVFCVLLIIRSLSDQLITVFSDCVYANEDIKDYCIAKSIFNILPIFIVYISFKFGAGPYVLYIALFICWELLGGIVIIYYTKKMYGLNLGEYCTSLIIPCLSSFAIACIFGFMVVYTIDESFYRLILTTSVSVLVLLIISWYYVFDQNERVLVGQMLTGFRNRFL